MSTLLKSSILEDIDSGSYSDWYMMKCEVWLDSQSIENNTSTITIKRFYGTQSNSAGWYKFTTPKLRNYLSTNNSSWQDLGYTSITDLSQNNKGNWVQFGTWSGTVSHQADGSQIINVRTEFTHNTSLSTYPYLSKDATLDTGNITLPTIARASIPTLSSSSFNIANTITINTNRYSSSFTHTIRVAFGSWSKTIATGVGASYNWNTNNDASNLYAQIPSSNSGTGTIYVDTYSGNTLIGTKSVGFTAKVTNSNPTFTASQITYLDSNSSVVSITGNNQHIVRNKSNLKVTFTSATAKNSATISSYLITFNGNSQTKTAGSTIDYGTINLANNATITIKVTDSRGNTTTASKTITIIDWTNPTAVITAGRLNNYEDNSTIKAQVTISSVNSKNAITELKYRYKKTSDSSWSAYTNLSNNTDAGVVLDKNYAWDFQIYIADKFGNTTYNFVIAKGTPIIFFDINKISVGVNKFPTHNKSFDVDVINGKSIVDLVYPVGSIYMSLNSTNPNTLFGGTWQQISGRFLWATASTPNQTGGSQTQTLSVNNLPSHNHSIPSLSGSTDSKGSHSHTGKIHTSTDGHNSGSFKDARGWDQSGSKISELQLTNSTGGHTHTVTTNASTTGNKGSGTAFSIMPPYLEVYMWKRTA